MPAESRRIRLTVAYDGTDFSGFQSLPDRRTVQGALQAALSAHCGEAIRIFGAGRTDAGVHAEGQVVHFDTVSRTPADRYPQALGRHLPRDVAVVGSEEAPSDFHARFSARSRVYRYVIVPGRRRSPLMGRVSWMPDDRPDWTLFREEAARLIGERDFRSFALRSEGRSTVRKLLRAQFREERGAGFLTVEANAFLRGMVRWIVAALWARAVGTMNETELTGMIEGESRPETLVPAPPQGLTLIRVRYGPPDR